MGVWMDVYGLCIRPGAASSFPPVPSPSFAPGPKAQWWTEGEWQADSRALDLSRKHGHELQGTQVLFRVALRARRLNATEPGLCPARLALH
jgi:hypothetical protein